MDTGDYIRVHTYLQPKRTHYRRKPHQNREQNQPATYDELLELLDELEDDELDEEELEEDDLSIKHTCQYSNMHE
jgi:hypothetical protein